MSHARADVAPADAQLRKPTVVEHLRSIHHETVDADVLDARHVPHEPRDGVDSGMGPPAKLRLAEPLDRRVGQDLVDLRVADQHEIGRVHGGQSTKSPRRGSPRTATCYDASPLRTRRRSWPSI